VSSYGVSMKGWMSRKTLAICWGSLALSVVGGLLPAVYLLFQGGDWVALGVVLLLINAFNLGRTAALLKEHYRG
jgi:hypothetical protein